MNNHAVAFFLGRDTIKQPGHRPPLYFAKGTLLISPKGGKLDRF